MSFSRGNGHQQIYQYLSLRYLVQIILDALSEILGSRYPWFGAWAGLACELKDKNVES